MVIAIVIARKIFKNLYIKLNTINALFKLDKFTHKMFNKLLHDWKISRLLITSFLFGFLNHYFLITIMKTFNIMLLKTNFKLILSGQNFN